MTCEHESLERGSPKCTHISNIFLILRDETVPKKKKKEKKKTNSNFKCSSCVFLLGIWCIPNIYLNSLYLFHFLCCFFFLRKHFPGELSFYLFSYFLPKLILASLAENPSRSEIKHKSKGGEIKKFKN